jgi:hypothetical protein
MADDELMTLRGTHNLVNLYANTERRVESISPAELKVRRIGHFGFFATSSARACGRARWRRWPSWVAVRWWAHQSPVRRFSAPFHGTLAA